MLEIVQFLMSREILSAILSGLATLLGGLTTYLVSRNAYRESRRELAKKGNVLNYRERMNKLSAELARASSEIDNVLEEMAIVSRAREEALKGLESKVDELSNREKELQTQVETLKNVPLPAVEYFLQVSEKGEKRSATRDYILFGLGVIVSTVVAIVLKLVFSI